MSALISCPYNLARKSVCDAHPEFSSLFSVVFILLTVSLSIDGSLVYDMQQPLIYALQLHIWICCWACICVLWGIHTKRADSLSLVRHSLHVPLTKSSDTGSKTSSMAETSRRDTSQSNHCKI